MFGLLIKLMAGAAVIYGALIMYPGLLLRSVSERGAFRIKSDIPLTERQLKFAGNASPRLRSAGILSSGESVEVLYFSSPGKYSFMAPYCGSSPVCVHPLKNMILIGPADLEKGTAADGGVSKELDYLLAFNTVLMKRKASIGPVSYYTSSRWPMEGYADQVAWADDNTRRPEDICWGNVETDPERAMYLRRLALEHIMRENKLLRDAVIDGSFSFDVAVKALKRTYCGG